MVATQTRAKGRGIVGSGVAGLECRAPSQESFDFKQGLDGYCEKYISTAA